MAFLKSKHARICCTTLIVSIVCVFVNYQHNIWYLKPHSQLLLTQRSTVSYNQASDNVTRSTTVSFPTENSTYRIETSTYSIPDNTTDVYTPVSDDVNESFNSTIKIKHLLDQKPIEFVNGLKNPCWYEYNSENGVKTLSCMPYFFIGGFPKCGTTDLFRRLTLHPGIVRGCRKEPHYWTRCGFTGKTFNDYVKCFSGISSLQSRVLDRLNKGEVARPNRLFSRFITVDASASTLWDDSYWRKIKQNSGAVKVPRVSTTHLLNHVLPAAKIVVIMRNPTDRLYSDYTYFSKQKGQTPSPNEFHSFALKATSAVNNCTIKHTIGWCIYNKRVRSKALDLGIVKGHHRFTLNIGLYAIYLEKWLHMFPMKQMHFIRFEDYQSDIREHIKDILGFLNTPLPKDKLLLKMATREKANTQKSYVPMLPVTRQLLDKFYKPYNARLAQILGDKRYLWLEKNVVGGTSGN